MLNKWEAAGQLAEQRLPLYTSEIRQCLRKTHEGVNAPAPVFSAVLELVKLHPDHFGDLMSRKTKGHSIKGKCIWTNPDTDYEFHDVDIEVVLKYLRICLYIQSRFARMPHAAFVQMYSAFHSQKKAALIEQGMRCDQDMFFSQNPALMDDTRWDNWLRLARWTEEEAVGLSLDKDPDIVSSESIQNQQRDNDLPSPFLEEYQQRMRQLKRAIEDREELTPLRPASFMSWAVSAYKDLPARFIEMTSDNARQSNQKSAGTPNTRDQDIDVTKMNAKSRRTLRLMLLCMAIDKYGHNVDALKSPATKAIVDAFYDVGLTIDAGTVKDVLTDAANDVNLQTDVATIREATKRS